MIVVLEQGSDKQGIRPWIEFYPEIGGLTLSIPEWTFRANGIEKVFPAASHTFVPNATYAKEVALYLTPAGYELQLRLLDTAHLPPPLPTGFDAQTGAPRVLWFTLPAGCADLAEVEISVLRSVER